MSEEKHITEFAAQASAILQPGDQFTVAVRNVINLPGPAECFEFLKQNQYDLWFNEHGVCCCGTLEGVNREVVDGTGATPLAAVQAAWRANQ